MIVLIESHAREGAPRQPEVAAPACGARCGQAAEYNFDRTGAEIENEARGGIIGTGEECA